MEATEPQRTELSEMGEFGLIKHLTESIQIHHEDNLIKGVGDDAAVIQPSADQVQVVSTDLLSEGVHFDLSYVPLKHLGYKAVVVNISDIYAMNATPKQITISLAISNRFSLEAIEEFWSGVQLAAKRYEVDIVGGDTTSSMSGLMVSITAIGEANKEKVVYRNGANDSDLIVVSGDLGSAYMGLQVLEREKSVWATNPDIQPDLDGFDYLLERQLKPEARKDIVQFLADLDVAPTAMIDISDGLASEALHLCESSGLGCDLYEDKFPLDPTMVNTCVDFELDPAVVALSGGEDYELLFTIKQSDYEKLKGSPHFTVIGHMKDKSAGSHMISKGGQAIELTAQGWNAFKE